MSKHRLNIPYKQQKKPNSCFAAAAESIYAYYQKNRREEQIWNERKSVRPYSTEDFILVKDIVRDFNENGLTAYYSKADLTDRKAVQQLLQRFISQKVPILICNQYTDALRQKGHARIITGVSKSSVYFHDPDANIGGMHKKWDWATFFKRWEATGEEVTGGVYIIAENK